MQALYDQSEEYYLQIDSHMRLVKNWDLLLIEYLNQCPNPDKSILTVYPRSYKKGQTEFPSELEGPLVMCMKEFSKVD